MTTGYFDTPFGIALLAHRGLVLPGSGVFENTRQAFQNALDAGATHLETDVQATRDGVAVLLHDVDLYRLIGDKSAVAKLTFSELLARCASAGFEPLSLEAALTDFPDAKFNLDVKAWKAVEPTASTIEALSAHDRVLVSSFSDARRLATLRNLQRPVATSAGAGTVFKSRIASGLRLQKLLGVGVLGIQALQIPTSMYGLKFATKNFVSDMRKLGINVHFWTVNSAEQALQLIDIGATGIVSDRVDLLSPFLGKP